MSLYVKFTLDRLTRMKPDNLRVNPVYVQYAQAFSRGRDLRVCLTMREQRLGFLFYRLKWELDVF